MTRITVETTVRAPLATVWRAYTTPADIQAWNAASDAEQTHSIEQQREGWQAILDRFKAHAEALA